MKTISSFGLTLALAMGAGTLAAQNPAPPTAPPAPAPAAVQQPALLRPPTAPPPPAPMTAQAAANRPATPAVVRPMPRASAPPDSVRPVAPPAAVIRPAPVASPPPPAPLAAAPAPVRAAAPASAAPAGATMRCKDGSYLTGAAAPGRCDGNGGLAAVLPTSQPTPPRPAPSSVSSPRRNP